MKDLPAVSSDGKRHYESWDALVAAESNGYLATLILEENAPKKSLFTFSTGPWPTKREANNARIRMRNRHRRETAERGVMSRIVGTHVTPAWKQVDR